MLTSAVGRHAGGSAGWSVLPAAAGLFLTLVPPAVAQVGGPNNPEPPLLNGNASYLTSQILQQSGWVISSGVSSMVGQRLVGVTPPGMPVPYPNAFAPQRRLDEVDAAWLAFDGDEAGKMPGPGAVAASVTPLWNIWLDANLTHSERDDAVAGSEGDLFTGSLGLDRRVGNAGVLGLIVNYEAGDYDLPPSDGSYDTSGAGGGIYGGYALTDRIVLDGLVMWKHLDNDLADPFSVASYDAERWVATANVTGYFSQDQWRISPRAGVIWSREDQDSYVDSLERFVAGTVIETTTLHAGGQLGYAFYTAAGRSIEPWAGATAEWTVSDDTSPPPEDPGRSLDGFDVRLSGGLKTQLSDAVSLNLKVDVSGLARSGYSVVTGGGQLAIRF